MKKPPFSCKGSTISVLVVHLQTLDLAMLAEAADKMYGGHDFFGDKACLLDLGAIAPVTQQAAVETVDWPALAACYAAHGLKVVGVRGGIPELMAKAREAGLAAFAPETRPAPASELVAEEKTAEKVMEKDAEATQSPAETEVPPAEPMPPVARGILFLDRPLRSGQVVYARDSDLVVTAFVSPGAEIIADGNIYSYAPLRGRAHAGAGGDTAARIFATQFAAEVVAIAHQPLALTEGIPATLVNRTVQVRR
ncbi:MAG: septum site-determining protein MinC, partial [Zoogloeaceae bacterium]|nr:septum site-determining protein MinC [Zoogloeaceae bacterium]